MAWVYVWRGPIAGTAAAADAQLVLCQ
jgi:hypothetical protein